MRSVIVMLLSGILEDGGGRWLGWKGGGCGSNMASGALPKLTALPQEERCSNLRTLWQVWPDYYGIHNDPAKWPPRAASAQNVLANIIHALSCPNHFTQYHFSSFDLE